ncbi:MAG: M48 family metalloprotease, partial [Bacteroidales bacterium]|nr:M48 family metalloprotease [Bacteroidales bacterium]
MQGVLEKAYNGFLGAIDGFANCSAGTAAPVKPAEEAKPDAASIPDYAYPCDNYINSVLDNTLVRKTLRTIATKYYGNQIEKIIQTASELTPLNYPNLYANYQHCCETLNVTNPPKVYITSCLSGINALSVEMNDTAVILLSYMSVIALNDMEQRFLLGHELGHIQLGHMVVHTVQGLLQDLNTRAELLGPIVTDL